MTSSGEMADSNNNTNTSSTRKRTPAGNFVSYDDQILQWLEEDNEYEFSDVDDEDGDPTLDPESKTSKKTPLHVKKTQSPT
ncbi:hypothetical protein HHI36_008863 [Cryptolaemus montrouzieri]|uniref:Uncharacterized protein n=1 Tax=Cryptolaemus montrouzieri TaxID=559131 RepID=A0ABD2MTR9_9CUCU